MTEPRKPTTRRKPQPAATEVVTPPDVVEDMHREADEQAAIASAKRPPKSPEALAFKTTISQGDHGPKVDSVQTSLAALGRWDGPVDGRYGTALAKAVRQFQDSVGLKITGDVNVTTWEALSSAAKGSA